MDNQNISQTQPNQAESLLNTESTIHRVLNDIEKLKDDIKEQKNMFDSAIENDASYEAQMKKEEEIKKATAGIKQKLQQTPTIMAASEKVKELKDDMKDLQNSLSTLLKQYQKISGSNIITREDGSMYEIVSTMKLVKKSLNE